MLYGCYIHLKDHAQSEYDSGVWACQKLQHWDFGRHHKYNKCHTLYVVLHFELYLFVTLSVILTLFQGHSSVKQFELKVLCYLIKLKLCRITLSRS